MSEFAMFNWNKHPVARQTFKTQIMEENLEWKKKDASIFVNVNDIIVPHQQLLRKKVPIRLNSDSIEQKKKKLNETGLKQNWKKKLFYHGQYFGNTTLMSVTSKVIVKKYALLKDTWYSKFEAKTLKNISKSLKRSQKLDWWMKEMETIKQ